MTDKARKARKARSALANVQESQVAAMRSLSESDPATMQAMFLLVAGMTRSDDGEVGAYASRIAPAMWQARRDVLGYPAWLGYAFCGTPLIAVVTTAVRKARRNVKVSALEGWDLYGDMTELEESADIHGDARTSVSHYGTAPADAIWNPTYGDAYVTAVALTDPAPRMTVVRAIKEWTAHNASGCCHGAGRPVTVAGITAHLNGWLSDDSRYHASRRHVLASLASVPRERVLELTGDMGRPTYGRNSVSVGNGYAGHVAPDMLPATAPRVLPAVTVTRVESRTVDHVWEGSRDFRLSVWHEGRIVRVPVGMGSIMPQRVAGMSDMERHGGLQGVCDSLGYPLRLGYGHSPDVSGEWRGVRQETTRVVELPAVTVAARDEKYGPSVVVVGRVYDANGYPASLDYGAPVLTSMRARGMTDDERTACGAPDVGRIPLAPSGDASDAAPDDSPLGGDLTASGVLMSYKPVIPSRKRTRVGNTDSTVPVRLAR